MKLLSVDSTATACSVALMEDEKVLGEFYCNTKLTHSQTLMVMTEQMMSCTGYTLQDIDGFAVSAGPGSFTGVRIGVSAVKGMAMALHKPCVGVSTLEAMAQNLRHLTGIVCALMDARCGQVYTALFRVEKGVLERLTEDSAMPADQVAENCGRYEGPVYLAGDGAELCSRREDFQTLSAVLLPEPLRFQRACGVAKAARERFLRGEEVDASKLMPVYLRPPQAERELKKRLKKA